MVSLVSLPGPTRLSHFWGWLTRVLSTAMTERFRKPRIRKFGAIRLTCQQPQGGIKGEGTRLQGHYEAI